jgi:hypothetical protein
VPKKIDPRVRELAVQAVREGGTLREVAALCAKAGTKVTAMTVKRWADEAGPLAHMAAPADDAEIEDLPTDPLEALIAMRNMYLRDSARARAAGHHAAAASATSSVTKLSLLIARVEKERRSSGDGVTFTAAEVAAARESVDARLEALRARPLLCAECGRALSIEWGDGAKVADGGHGDHTDTPKVSRKV